MGITEEGDLQVYEVDVDVILGNCTIPFCYTYLTKDQQPPSNLVVFSTIQCSTIEIMI